MALSPEKFQSTLPARGATEISGSLALLIVYFNPRSPRGERRAGPPVQSRRQKFQSTLPARGATPFVGSSLDPLGVFQSTLPARGATASFSFHAPSFLFQSTLPARGATGAAFRQLPAGMISIHAPREGSDNITLITLHRRKYFNPRSPRGERLHSCIRLATLCSHFNPRSPRGERPDHKSRTGCLGDFNPRSPRGERPDCRGKWSMHCHFNPRSPRGERRKMSTTICRGKKVFQSTLPARGATPMPMP